ncbi:isochorismatase family protein [Ornithinimicrobium murale]|uniref:isochorismatase family protein n=1 Tax=Ornithinimicrobium murale TaxID=1050153 RepID=UPI000E0D03B1|nr:isochorismatase family protein [Ornithinimicrobium murale]
MSTSVLNQFAEERQFYLDRGFGDRVGFGVQPALLVIDLARAWLDERSQLGASLDDVVEHAVELLAAARLAEVPVFFTTTAYAPGLLDRGAVINKKRPGRDLLVQDSEWVDLDPRLNRRDDEVLIVKQRASAFFGTTLLSQLVAKRVDTVILAGCSTSGCVRETASSAHDYNLHVIIAEEAVGDRSARAHANSLLDMDRSIGDVMAVADVVSHVSASA